MKVRITLKYRVDDETNKKGDILVIFNEIFDSKNGVAFFEIDKNTLELVKFEQFTEFYDEHGKEVYVGDKIQGVINNTVVEGYVIFAQGAMSIDVKRCNSNQYDTGNTPCLFDFYSLKLING